MPFYVNTSTKNTQHTIAKHPEVYLEKIHLAPFCVS